MKWSNWLSETRKGLGLPLMIPHDTQVVSLCSARIFCYQENCCGQVSLQCNGKLRVKSS